MFLHVLVIAHKRATNYRALLRKMTYQNKASCAFLQHRMFKHPYMLSAKEPPMKGFFCGKWPIKISLPPCMFPHDWVISHRQMLQVSFFRWATNDRALLREMTYQNIFATLYVLTWMGYCTQANQSRHAYCTGWRRTVGCLKLQVIFHNRATDYRALL